MRKNITSLFLIFVLVLIFSNISVKAEALQIKDNNDNLSANKTEVILGATTAEAISTSQMQTTSPAITTMPTQTTTTASSVTLKTPTMGANFIWIWQLQSDIDKYGGIDNLISKLKALGINNVCIKYHEGSDPIGGGVNYREAFLKYVKNFKDAGFKVGTWGYNYFNHIPEESNLIIEALSKSDYYIFDVEDTVSGKAAEAEQICKLVRGKYPKAILGYSSLPIISYHKDIPYSVFNKYCDFASPQCYWGEMQYSINKCIDDMQQNYKNYKLDKPLYPSIQTYKITPDDYKAYAKYGFKTTGGWSLDAMNSDFENFASNNKVDESIQKINSKKEWVIKFNKVLNSATINNKTIFVKDSNNNIVSGVSITLLNSGQDVKVSAPANGYSLSSTYTLVITTDVCSTQGKKLKEVKMKQFTISQ